MPISQRGAGRHEGTIVSGAALDFEEAWGRFGREIFQRCVTWMSGRRSDGEEAFGRAGVLAFQKYGLHRGGVLDARRWLLRLAYNVCMDLHRERRREPSLVGYDAAAPGLETSAPGEISNPERAHLRRELASLVRRRIAELPPRLRTALKLRMYAELRDRDIAKVLGISEANVRKRLQEARARLRPLLKTLAERQSSAGPGQRL